VHLGVSLICSAVLLSACSGTGSESGVSESALTATTVDVVNEEAGVVSVGIDAAGASESIGYTGPVIVPAATPDDDVGAPLIDPETWRPLPTGVVPSVPRCAGCLVPHPLF